MKHLAELEIRSFRNVRPTKLVFRPGINVVLGKNAAGKTTLLNLLSSVVWGVADHEATEAYEWTSVVRSGSTELRRVSQRVPVEPAIPNLPPSFAQSDEFELTDGASTLSAKVHNGRAEIDNQDIGHEAGGGPALLVLLRALAKGDDLEARKKLFSLGVTVSSRRLDESLEYFRELLAITLTSGGKGPSSSLSGTPEGFRHPKLVGTEGPRLTVVSDFVLNAARVMGYERAEALFDVESKSNGQGSERTLRNLRFLFSFGKQTIFHDSLSYGEKRLLSFFAMADACPEIIIVDELVNGLHHEWIKACLAEISARQAFLTSQNPLLLDYLEFSDADEVARSFVLCERVRTERGVELLWRNPTAEEAGDFFHAYESGIQRVSDILITKGFW